VSEVPREIRILGEDLVIFKTSKGNIGLVHKACPHRRASMAYGKTEDEGIRCCYHGWLFSPNGEILETPGEDPESKQAKKLRETFKLGAYPIIEFNGLGIFLSWDRWIKFLNFRIMIHLKYLEIFLALIE
jgi:phenylpropionate dioxygenase-like ring-hydroxylating dioxygenase large terminal subunit